MSILSAEFSTMARPLRRRYRRLFPTVSIDRALSLITRRGSLDIANRYRDSAARVATLREVTRTVSRSQHEEVAHSWPQEVPSNPPLLLPRGNKRNFI